MVGAAIRLTTERFPASGSPPAVAAVPLVHGDATYVEQAVRNLILAFVRGAQPAGINLTARLDVDRSGREVASPHLPRGGRCRDDELGLAFELPSASTTGRLAAIGLGSSSPAMPSRRWAAGPGR